MNELATQESHLPVTVAEMKAQVNRIQEIMHAVMQDGIHYGKVPGCGDKPALLKAGAEKILATFRIAVSPDVEDLSTPDICRVRVKAVGATPNGIHVGTGIGECSSDEEKYKWKAATCDAEFAATDDARRRIKYQRDGRQIKQIRTNPADVANTVLKMAKKRALVDLCLTATAASDCFTQDLDDDVPPAEEKPLKTVQQPKAKAEEKREDLTPPPGDGPGLDENTVTGLLKSVDKKQVGKNKSDKWGLQLHDGRWAGTFDATFGTIAEDAYEAGKPVVVTVEKSPCGKYWNAVNVAVL